MNEIKWNKFVKESKKDKKILEFLDCVAIVLDENNLDKNLDETIFNMDKLLLEMTKKQELEMNYLLKKTFFD